MHVPMPRMFALSEDEITTAPFPRAPCGRAAVMLVGPLRGPQGRTKRVYMSMHGDAFQEKSLTCSRARRNIYAHVRPLRGRIDGGIRSAGFLRSRRGYVNGII